MKVLSTPGAGDATFTLAWAIVFGEFVVTTVPVSFELIGVKSRVVILTWIGSVVCVVVGFLIYCIVIENRSRGSICYTPCAKVS